MAKRVGNESTKGSVCLFSFENSFFGHAERHRVNRTFKFIA